MDAVPSVMDHQKDEAKVCFMDSKCKDEAETEMKAVEGHGKKGSANKEYWCKHPKKKNST
jgi:hypothetical protein